MARKLGSLLLTMDYPPIEGGIAEKVITLFKDKDLYETFSRNGLEHAKKFSWEKSVERLRPYL